MKTINSFSVALMGAFISVLVTVMTLMAQVKSFDFPPVLTPGEPEDGLSEWYIMTPSNKTELLVKQELHFAELEVPVSVWSFRTTTNHTYMNRALMADFRITDEEQCALLIYAYQSPDDFHYAGIVAGSWDIGHFTGEPYWNCRTNRVEAISPQLDETYSVNVEIRKHDLVFSVFDTNNVEVVRINKSGSSVQEGFACGTARFGLKNSLVIEGKFQIKRLFKKKHKDLADKKIPEITEGRKPDEVDAIPE